MKTIKVILGLLFAFSLSVSAQQMRFGVTGGMNVTSTSSFDNQVGFRLGGKAELDASFIGKGFFFDASLLLSQKPLKATADGNLYFREDEAVMPLHNYWKATPTYLELPIHFGYRFKVGDAVSLFVKGGPYVAFGVFGKVKTWQTTDGVMVHDVKESAFKNWINRFDWGLGLRVGAEFLNHYQISVGHDWGLKGFEKAHPSSDKHRTYSISVSYMF